MLKKDSVKRKRRSSLPFVISICALLVIIPTVIAIFYVYFQNEGGNLKSNSLKVELFDESNTLLASEEVAEVDISSSHLANAFFSIVSAKSPTSTNIAFESTPNFSFTIHYLDNAENYFCYFTDSYETSYISDKKGTFFSLSEDSYELFLNLEFSEPVHPEAFSPDLITGDEETVVPNDVNWNYEKANGQFVESISNHVTSSVLTYELSGAINLSFESQPSNCVAKIYSTDKKSNNMVFEGSLDELSSLKLPHDTAFSVVIDASWYKSEESTSYGDAHYEFNVIIRNKAEFFVSATEIKAGGFITLTVKNAQTLSKLFYTADGDALVSTPEEYSDNETAAIQSIYSFSPNFVLNASTAQAIIAFPADLPSLTFEFQLSYGASEQDFSIKVEKQSYTDYAFSKAKKELKAILSDEGMSKIKNTLNKIPNSPQDTVFFDYAFSAPQNFTSGYTYFNYVIPNDSDEGFISFGNEYLATTKGGQAVNALNSGIVTKVGKTSQLGNYVVIDHGLGLKTVYCGLSDVNVSVGSAISQNVSIGKCGTSPMVSEDGFLLMCVANDTVINPLHIIGKNIK